MTENFDKGKVVEDLFNPDISVILAELEDGSKESSFLASKLDVSEDEIRDRLNYLIESGFVDVSDSPFSYSVNTEKIAKIMENEENYKGVIDGLTELDSYLN
jgi:predicted transcriptional regulator